MYPDILVTINTCDNIFSVAGRTFNLCIYFIMNFGVRVEILDYFMLDDGILQNYIILLLWTW